VLCQFQVGLVRLEAPTTIEGPVLVFGDALREYRLAHAGVAALCLVVAGAALAACNLTSMDQGNDPPDALDRVRNRSMSCRGLPTA
jgi:hypothetical protein